MVSFVQYTSPLLWIAAWTIIAVTTSITTSAFHLPLYSSAAAKIKVEQNADILKSVVTRVAVTGATGRTGRFIVEELLARGVSSVVAIVRDSKKAEEVFPNPPPNLKLVQCDLGNADQIVASLDGCDAAIWCATGLSDNPDTDPLEKVKRLFGFAVAPQQAIDTIAVPIIAKYLVDNITEGTKKKQSKRPAQPLPKFVMCSSAAVTRPGWDKAKKAKYKGVTEIPIVRLNPFNILERKLESEIKLRETGVPYCIVRPCGLNDNWPSGSRPVLTQGDVASGRNNRRDLAKVLVDVLSHSEATGKTFEIVGIAGYAPPLSLAPALARLKLDTEGTLSEEAVEATYNLLQQLQPGEKQDAAALAMGQTFEQLDAGTVGRLGVRGKENLSSVRI